MSLTKAGLRTDTKGNLFYPGLKSALWFSVSAVFSFHAYRTNSATFTGMKKATFPRQGHKIAKLK
jgi:hypothetical protein